MSGALIGKLQRPPVPAWLREHISLPKAAGEKHGSTGLRNIPGADSSALIHTNFQRIVGSPLFALKSWSADGAVFRSGLLEIEAVYGTAAAFAFGLAIESGSDTAEKILGLGSNLDILYARITNGTDPASLETDKAKVQLIEQGRKALKPWEYCEVKHGFGAVVANYAGEAEKVKGDCVDIAVLKAYLFLRMGLEAGIQTNFEHTDALVRADGADFLYRTAEVSMYESGEICLYRAPEGFYESWVDRLIPYRIHALRPAKNFLGAIAQTTLDRANLYRELNMPDWAKKLYQRAKALDNIHPDIYAGLGWIAAQEGDFETALILLTTAVEVGTEDPAVFIQRGEILLAANHIAEAQADFRLASSLVEESLAKHPDKVGFLEHRVTLQPILS